MPRPATRAACEATSPPSSGSVTLHRRRAAGTVTGIAAHVRILRETVANETEDLKKAADEGALLRDPHHLPPINPGD